MTATRQLALDYTAVAQLEERPIPNRERAGSIPARRATLRAVSPLSPEEQRDAALARHEQDEHKRRLREAADVVARELIARDGATCSPRVVAELKARGLGHLMMGLDMRAMGTVLLPSRGYEETGEYRNEGSKGRPAKMWRLAP